MNLNDDLEYYKSLSDKLKTIIRKHQEHWDELVQLPMNFRDSIEKNREHSKLKTLGYQKPIAQYSGG